MPSAYTDAVIKGEIASFKEFSTQCLRAMGVSVTMRDEPMSKPVPESFSTEAYYYTNVDKARARLVEVLNWTETQKYWAWIKATEELDSMFAEATQRANEARRTCEEMRDKVLAWVPPTEEHKGLKDFMIQQLVSTIDFDGRPPNREWYETFTTVSEFYEETLKGAERDFESARKHRDEAIERTRSRNEWLRAFRNSLDDPNLVD